MKQIHATTVLCVARNKQIVMMSDSQVTAGFTICKDDYNKLRTLTKPDSDLKVIAGFSGTVTDCLALSDKLKEILEETANDLRKAVSKLAKQWKTDRNLRRYSAEIIVADSYGDMYAIDGHGLIIRPSENRGMILSTGSGSVHAYAAALALYRENPAMDAKKIVEKAMTIASELDVFTNNKFNMLEIKGTKTRAKDSIEED